MAAKTAVEVAEMESELYLLRREKTQLEMQVALLSQERDACKVELAMSSSRAREEMMKSTQLETIISQTSMGLVSALRSYHAQRQAERVARQMVQERELGVGEEDAPAFLQRRQQEREEADDALSQLSPAHRRDPGEAGRAMADRMRELAEPSPQDRVLETKMTGRAPQRSEPTHQELADSAELIGRPLRPRGPKPAVKDHPLLPPLDAPGGPLAGDLGAMIKLTQEDDRG